MFDSFLNLIGNFVIWYGGYSISFVPILMSFFCGLFFTLWFSSERESKSEFTLSFYRTLIGLFFIAGPFSHFAGPFLVEVFFDQPVTYKTKKFLFHIVFFILGIFSQFLSARYIEPIFQNFFAGFTKKNELLRNQKTDVRNIHELLPKHVKAEIEKFTNTEDKVFIGFDEKRKPVFLDYEVFKTSHIDVLGTTGAGKGVISQVLLSQALAKNEAVFVIDPKDDEWAASALKQKCEELGQQFHLIDLRKKDYAFNILEGAEPDQIEELFNAAFSLYPKGSDSDFYKIKDRDAASFMSNLAMEEGMCFIDKLAVAPEAAAISESAEGFFSSLRELAKIPALSARNGLNLGDVVKNGGCVYFVGSTRQSRIILAQRMLMTRLVQLCEDRDRTSNVRPVCVFLDELKYHISKPVIEALGTVRDKGMHILMAHQAIDDLRDCPSDLNGEAVIGSVVENCKIKIAYKVQNPETAEWFAKMSGKIQVDDETRKVSRNTGLSEIVDSERSVRQSERYFVDENMLLNLPVGVCVLYQPSVMPIFASVNRLNVQKQTITHFKSNGPSENDSSVAVPVVAGKPIVKSGAAAAIENFTVDDEPEQKVEVVTTETVSDFNELRQCPFCEEWTETASALKETFDCESCGAPLQLLEVEGVVKVAGPLEYLKDFEPEGEEEPEQEPETIEEPSESDFDSLFDEFSADEEQERAQ